jgi:tRNA threonylcarbamoyladenosine modification (KEOPS) complex  Pcc1 subunit
MEVEAQADIEIKFKGNPKDYVSILGKAPEYDRSSVEINAGKDSLKIHVSAVDAAALFASMNSALKQIRVISRVDDALERIGAKGRGRNAP